MKKELRSNVKLHVVFFKYYNHVCYYFSCNVRSYIKDSLKTLAVSMPTVFAALVCENMGTTLIDFYYYISV